MSETDARFSGLANWLPALAAVAAALVAWGGSAAQLTGVAADLAIMREQQQALAARVRTVEVSFAVSSTTMQGIMARLDVLQEDVRIILREVSVDEFAGSPGAPSVIQAEGPR